MGVKWTAEEIERNLQVGRRHRREHGLPEKITDPVQIARLVALFRGSAMAPVSGGGTTPTKPAAPPETGQED